MPLIPKGKCRAPQALKECQSANACELRVIAQDLRQTVEGNPAGQMVHVMHPDITREPGKGRWQLIVRTPMKRRFVKAPIAIVGPKRILELMLDIEEPHGDRGADDNHWTLHKEKRPDPHHPDHHSDNSGDRRVGSHCAEPGLTTRAHEANRKAVVQHKQIGRNHPEHDKRTSVKPIDEALEAGQRAIFVGCQRDDVAAAPMIEIASIRMMQGMRA